VEEYGLVFSSARKACAETSALPEQGCGPVRDGATVNFQLPRGSVHPSESHGRSDPRPGVLRSLGRRARARQRR